MQTLVFLREQYKKGFQIMATSTSTKAFKIGNGLRISISSLYVALFILSAGDLFRNFEDIQSIWNNLSYLDQFGIGSLLLTSLIVATVITFLLPIGSLYLVITGFRGKNNSRWLLISTAFSGSLVVLTSFVAILFVAQGFYSDRFIVGWKSFINLYFSNSGYGSAILGSREVLITAVTVILAVISLAVTLTKQTTFLAPVAKKIATWFSPITKRITQLWAPAGKQLSSKVGTKPSESGTFAKALLDVSFDKFIFIKVASLMYFIVLVLIGLFNILLVVLVVFGITLGSVEPEYILLIPASFLVSPLVIILTRLAFESGIALIKVAENTSKN
jgi:hypothetical protein